MEASGGLFLFAAELLLLAVVLHAVTRSIASGNLGRNAAIGIRTRATRASDAAWRAGHLAASARMMVAARTGYALGGATIGLGLLGAASGSSPAWFFAVPAVGTAAVIGLLLAAARRADRAARAAVDG
ncbi:SdpI family protein [Saccharopolyspora griseoalba]|uniref:SdpI family protein n=1 Tax=Saccharopolyspora griseoalba TaxID=1431848 RepID=A0ABW2LNI2_9PSEU